MTIPLVESHILSTLELLHYCRRFEGSLFAFSFERAEHCAALLMDLRVLIAARIKQLLFCPLDAGVLRSLASWSKSGDAFTVIKADIHSINEADFKLQLDKALDSHLAVVVAWESPGEASAACRSQLEKRVFELALALKASKVVFPIAAPGLLVDGSLKGYPTNQQVRDAIAGGALLNLPPQWISFLIEQQERYGIDVVLVEARRGAIFEEVFTHAGSGTLFTREYPNVLRTAHEGDVRDIMALLQPYVAEGSLKPVTEEEILSTIRSFKVFEVNGQIVCAAALKEYGECCELTKLCTLPRFQARGRAGALVQALLDEAKRQGKRAVFALTVQSYVGDFFERLGFHAVEREALPEQWKSGYDFARPSKAYLVTL